MLESQNTKDCFKVFPDNKCKQLRNFVKPTKALKFLTNTHKEITSINAINAVVPTLLCHAVLPQMIERKRGLVLIMSSGCFKMRSKDFDDIVILMISFGY